MPLHAGQGRQFMADQQAGQIIHLRRGAELTGQAEAARTEHGRQGADFAVRRQRHLHAAIERIAIE
ncbi:hypothetical protein D3C84_1049430 [compost metagenome]